MGSPRFDRHTLISDLGRAEDEATAALSRMLSPYFHYGATWVPDWVFQNGERVRRVERALNASPALALSLLGQQLNNIDLREIWPVLRGVLEDVALYLGGPAALGGAIGGGIGFFAGGVGAVPGALAGSAAGAAAGSLLLSLLGLKSLLQYMLASVPKAAECYLRGFKMAWGPVAQDVHRHGDGSRILHRSDFDCCASPEFAAEEFARGHVVIVLALLAAIVAYLTRGRGDLPALLAEIRASPRLGSRMAAWVEQNAEKLKNQPVLQTAHQNAGLGELAVGKTTAGMAPGEKRAAADAAQGAKTIQLRSVQQMLGQTDGGPGTWGRSPKRVKGEAYQEQITGVERGIEYDVPFEGVKTGKVRFDGYDVERKVLLDAKDWTGYPPLNADFWHEELLKQARNQVRAANSVPVEWHFSSQSGLDAAKDLLKEKKINDILLVLSPKR